MLRTPKGWIEYNPGKKKKKVDEFIKVGKVSGSILETKQKPKTTTKQKSHDYE